MENKVVLGLSGGVDSAVAARLLSQQGFQVHCVYLDNGVGDPRPARQAAGYAKFDCSATASIM